MVNQGERELAGLPYEAQRGGRLRRVRSKTIGIRDLRSWFRSADAKSEAALYPEQPGVDYHRPETRADCKDGPRPCPFVSCRWHLFLDVKRNGGLLLNFPDLEPHELRETCTLDVAERGGKKHITIGRAMNLVRERIRQIEDLAIAHLSPKDRAVLEEWSHGQ